MWCPCIWANSLPKTWGEPLASYHSSSSPLASSVHKYSASETYWATAQVLAAILELCYYLKGCVFTRLPLFVSWLLHCYTEITGWIWCRSRNSISLTLALREKVLFNILTVFPGDNPWIRWKQLGTFRCLMCLYNLVQRDWIQGDCWVSEDVHVLYWMPVLTGLFVTMNRIP